MKDFVRIQQGADYTDVESQGWDRLKRALLLGNDTTLVLYMIGGDELIIRCDSIDSISFLTTAGTAARIKHQMEYDELFGGDDDDDGSRKEAWK